MKVLVIEDDENKRHQLVEYLRTVPTPCVLRTASSFQSGLKAIIDSAFDLVILDMTMPTFDVGSGEGGGRHQAYAGREILRQMDRRDIPGPVIVVTQFDRFGEGHDELSFDELHEELVEEQLPNYVGLVYYNP